MMTATPIVLVHGTPETPAVWDLLVDRLREHDLPVPVWLSDAVGVLEPGYVWHPLAQMWQEPGAGEDWVHQQLSLTTSQRVAGYTDLGMDARVAAPVAAGFDDCMGATILSLYRNAAQPVMAELGAGLAAAGRRRGLVVIAMRDDAVGTVDARRHAAARAGARTAELDAGHWWMTEHDGRHGADALIGFWEELV